MPKIEMCFNVTVLILLVIYYIYYNIFLFVLQLYNNLKGKKRLVYLDNRYFIYLSLLHIFPHD